MTERLALLIALCVAAAPAAAQSPTGIPPLRLGDYLLNLPTNRTIVERSWEMRFTHRFAQPVNEGDVHSFWGLDGAADIGLGLTYGHRENLQLAVFRSDILDNVEISAKYAPFRQSETVPLSVAVRAGVDWKTERGVERRVAPFAQLILARQVNRKLELFLVPTWSAHGVDYESAVNIGFGAAWAMRPNLLLVGEMIPENRDAPRQARPGLAWAVGVKHAVGGHFFEVLLTDSRATHVDQYVGSVPVGGISEGNIHLGFNIVRRFGGRR